MERTSQWDEGKLPENYPAEGLVLVASWCQVLSQEQEVSWGFGGRRGYGSGDSRLGSRLCRAITAPTIPTNASGILAQIALVIWMATVYRNSPLSGQPIMEHPGREWQNNSGYGHQSQHFGRELDAARGEESNASHQEKNEQNDEY
jgi:hypothetical protein